MKDSHLLTQHSDGEPPFASPAETHTYMSLQEKKVPSAEAKKYIFAVGRRKTAIARVKLYTKGKGGDIIVNKKPLETYFPTSELQKIVRAPLKQLGQGDKLDAEITVTGGGRHGQAESILLGLSRALVQLNPNFQKALRKIGFLTRDPRKKERKKPGLKRARRAPQWAKR